MAEMHLWEANHPYYASEGNYYRNGEHYRASSWMGFMEEMGDADEDYNLLYRWDWRQDDDAPPGTGSLLLFYMAQRKARCFSYEVAVTAHDEVGVREWLQKKWAHLQRVWAPFGVAP
jgi:hypothetical protein